jgi:hypothetical protein
MKIKRLKHHAQNLGQMFCGWQLMFDYKRLADLGSGKLFLNILTGECQFNGNPIPPLNITSILKQWLEQDLKANAIDPSALQGAELSVTFKIERYRGQKSDTVWSDPTPFSIGCTMDCIAKVHAFDRVFSSNYHDFDEWPESYSWCKGGHAQRA